MKKLILSLVLFSSVSALAETKNCVDEQNSQIAVAVQNGKMVISSKDKTEVSLNIQLTSEDGLVLVADAREKEQKPLAGSIMKNSTVLISFKNSNQALLQHTGHSYVVICR